jgi:hypothetical protein
MDEGGWRVDGSGVAMECGWGSGGHGERWRRGHRERMMQEGGWRVDEGGVGKESEWRWVGYGDWIEGGGHGDCIKEGWTWRVD